MPVIAPKAIGNDRRPDDPAGPSRASADTVTAIAGLLCSELAASRRDDVGAGVGVSLKSPATLGRLGDEHPSALRQLRIAGGVRDDVGQFPDDAQLLVAIEDPDRREDLHADVIAVTGNI